MNIREITENNGTLTFLLLIDVVNDVVLNQPNTMGYYPAYNQITMVDGFSTLNPPYTFQAWVITYQGQAPASSPVVPSYLYEVQVLNQENRWVGSYTISSAGDFDINSIRKTPDDKGHFLSNGDYKYILTKDGDGIVKGTFEIK